MNFVSDGSRRAYDIYDDIDVYAASTLTPQKPVVEGKFVVLEDTAAEGEMIVITAFAFCAYARVGAIDSGAEQLVEITPGNGNGFFSYQVRIGTGTPKDWSVGMNVSARTDKTSAVITNQLTGGGYTLITDNPALTIAHQRNGDELFSVPPGQTIQVLWNLLPDARSGALDQRYSIGGTVSGTKSVDVVGAALAGWRMPKSHYDMMRDAKKRDLARL